MPQGAAISREEKKVENKEVRILVVDDEPTMADSLRQNFVEEGYSVDTAATGAAAIECVVRNLSAAGTCLEVVSPIGIPEDFDLIIRPEYKRHHCHLVWRKAQRIGVRFV